MRRLGLALTMFALLVAGGCAALYSYQAPGEGIPYFLPQTLVRYNIDQTDPGNSHIETIEVPAKSRPRYLAYQANALADENLCIDRTETGLLKKVYFGSHDRTPDIVLNIVQLLAELAQDEAEEPEVVSTDCSGVAVSEWMDPYDFEAISRFNQRLCHVKIEVPAGVDFSTSVAECPEDAVCFATKSTMNAYLRGPGGAVAHTFDPTAVASKRDVGWVRVRTAFFNKRITQLDFTNGILTTMRVKKDSEILGLSQLPLNAIERVLAVPGNAVGMAFAGYQEKLLYLQRRKELKDAGANGAAPEQQDAEIPKKVLSCVGGQDQG